MILHLKSLEKTQEFDQFLIAPVREVAAYVNKPKMYIIIYSSRREANEYIEFVVHNQVVTCFTHSPCGTECFSTVLETTDST